MQNQTEIISNGSKWAGEKPDPIERLLEVLEAAVLDPAFEEFHCYKAHYYPTRGWLFFGNFLTVSHVFNIATKDKVVAKQLSEAIARNVASERYQKESFRRYRGWFYGRDPQGPILVCPKDAEYIRNGDYQDVFSGRKVERLKSIELLGPRFTPEETAFYERLVNSY